MPSLEVTLMKGVTVGCGLVVTVVIEDPVPGVGAPLELSSTAEYEEVLAPVPVSSVEDDGEDAGRPVPEDVVGYPVPDGAVGWPVPQGGVG